MGVLQIPCPNCRKELKIKDPALLGKRAKCPACEHKFVLAWTPEEDVPVEASDRSQPVPPGKRTKAGSQPQFERTTDDPVPAINVSPSDGVGRLNEIRRRNRQRRNSAIVIAAVFVTLIGGGYFLVRSHLPAAAPVPEPVAARLHTVRSAPVSPPTDAAPVTTGSDWVDKLDPTRGEPIELRMVPSGVRLIVNLRPAQLWSNDPQMAELRASLTQDVTGWLETQIRSVCRHEPSQIEEVLLAWILGARGTEPQLAAVVHLVEDARMSDLLDKFGSGAIDESAKYKVYQKDDHATLILDPKTFAIAPREHGAEVAEWVETPNYNTSDGLLELLPYTDRDRLATVLFEPADFKRHLEALVSEPARPVMSNGADWFAAQAETVSWSVHTGEEFHSEILLRGPRTSSALRVEEGVKQQMEALPSAMVESIRKMRPQRVGFRKIIGRFPAMLEVSRRATITSLEGKAVRLLTVMPPKAAPNLALGTILAWDESTRTDFSADAPQMAARPQAPDTLVGRLELPVDAEFNRVPLQEALDYIAGGIQASAEIDGDALKDAGFTKNMAQTFNLGTVPASRALAHLVGQYNEPGKQMVVVLDEPRMMLHVTTRKFADQQGLSVHDFGQ